MKPNTPGWSKQCPAIILTNVFWFWTVCLQKQYKWLINGILCDRYIGRIRQFRTWEIYLSNITGFRNRWYWRFTRNRRLLSGRSKWSRRKRRIGCSRRVRFGVSPWWWWWFFCSRGEICAVDMIKRNDNILLRHIYNIQRVFGQTRWLGLNNLSTPFSLPFSKTFRKSFHFYFEGRQNKYLLHITLFFLMMINPIYNTIMEGGWILSSRYFLIVWKNCLRTLEHNFLETSQHHPIIIISAGKTQL